MLKDMVGRHRVGVVAIGNGTACRETEELVAEIIAEGTEFSRQGMTPGPAEASAPAGLPSSDAESREQSPSEEGDTINLPAALANESIDTEAQAAAEPHVPAASEPLVEMLPPVSGGADRPRSALPPISGGAPDPSTPEAEIDSPGSSDPASDSSPTAVLEDAGAGDAAQGTDPAPEPAAFAEPVTEHNHQLVVNESADAPPESPAPQDTAAVALGESTTDHTAGSQEVLAADAPSATRHPQDPRSACGRVTSGGRGDRCATVARSASATAGQVVGPGQIGIIAVARHRASSPDRLHPSSHRGLTPPIRCSPSSPMSSSTRPVPASTRPARSAGKSCPIVTPLCAAASRSAAGSRTRWPSWSRSSPRISVSGSTSTTSIPST